MEGTEMDKIPGSFVEAVHKLWDNLKALGEQIYKGLRRFAAKTYVALLQQEVDDITSVLRVTKKTTARRQLLRRQRDLRERQERILRGLEE